MKRQTGQVMISPKRLLTKSSKLRVKGTLRWAGTGQAKAMEKQKLGKDRSSRLAVGQQKLGEECGHVSGAH